MEEDGEGKSELLQRYLPEARVTGLCKVRETVERGLGGIPLLHFNIWWRTKNAYS